MRKITLCGRGGCCPTVEIKKDKSVVIKDDYQGEVNLTQEQWKYLKGQIALGKC